MSINWSTPQSLVYIPENKLVTFTAIHQAQYEQHIQVIDAGGNPIQFDLLGGGTAHFPIHGSGTTANFFTNGSGKFIMKTGMKVQFANTGGPVSKVSATNPNQFFIEGQIFGGGVLYATEDGGGTDYNDTSFVVQWYATMG